MTLFVTKVVLFCGQDWRRSFKLKLQYSTVAMHKPVPATCRTAIGLSIHLIEIAGPS